METLRPPPAAPSCTRPLWAGDTAATRAVIVDAGYGEWFRHRTGHCIGMDVHEEPYISEEDETPLEVGMTFHAHSWFTNTDVVDYFISNTVMLTDNGAENLTALTPQTLTVR